MFIVELPAGDDQTYRSRYIFSYPKAGSVLLYAIVADIIEHAHLTGLDFPSVLFNEGVVFSDIENLTDIFSPSGIVYYGFRNYPDARLQLPEGQPALLMTRDPRDMLVSAYFSWAGSHPDSGGGNVQAELDRLRRIAQATEIDRFCLENASGFLSAFEEFRRIGHHNFIVLRYEDYIFDKRSLVSRIVDFLDTSISDEAASYISRRHDFIPSTEQPHQHLRRAVPGDHINKLQVDTIRELNTLLSPFLSYYGYE